jgi:predicted nucleic acid-binding protein
LLDTSAVLAHTRGEAGGDRVQALFDEPGSQLFAASISLAEFARRLRELGASPDEARRAAADYAQVLDEVVPVDARVALAAFDLGCEATRRLPLADALIAAAARERGACLVHRDPHFLSLPPHLLPQEDLSRGGS